MWIGTSTYTMSKEINQIIFSKGVKENEVDAHKYINSSIAIN